MGTRSLTVVRNFDNDIIVNIYRQMDGYPSCHGAKLKEILSERKIVNGIQDRETKMANGFNCLAAQLVAELKKNERDRYPGEYQTGGIYVQPAATWEDSMASYRYEIMPPEDLEKDEWYSHSTGNDKIPFGGEDLHLVVYDWDGDEVYNGSVEGFDPAEVD